MVLRKSLILFMLFIIALTTACSGQKSNENASQSNGQSGDGSKATHVFKLAHQNQTDHAMAMAVSKFKEELEKRSNGKMKIDIYPAAQLGNENQFIQQVEKGTLDFAIITNAYMSTRIESLNGWFMPFLFKNQEEAAKARNSQPARDMLKELEKQGFIGLDYVFAGNRHVLMKSTAVETMDDMKGKKIRVIGSPVIQQFWKSVGAAPTPMPLPEVYSAFQSGLIDGMDIDLDALTTQKYYEIGKELTMTNHMAFPAIIVASKLTFDKLTPEEQKLIRESMTAAADWGAEEAIKKEKSNLELLKSKGVKVHELSNKDALKPIQQAIYDEYSQKSPLIKSFIEANKK